MYFFPNWSNNRANRLWSQVEVLSPSNDNNQFYFWDFISKKWSSHLMVSETLAYNSTGFGNVYKLPAVLGFRDFFYLCLDCQTVQKFIDLRW